MTGEKEGGKCGGIKGKDGVGGGGKGYVDIPSMSWPGPEMTGSVLQGQLVRTGVGGVPETPGLYQHHSLDNKTVRHIPIVSVECVR